MPTPKNQRDYAKEYQQDKKTGKTKAQLTRQKARREFDKEHGHAARKGKHIAHKKALALGGTNKKDNLELESPEQNLHFHRKSNHDPVK